MQQKRAEIAAIALNPQTPDFNNTILALEQSGELLTRVTSVFFAMTAAHTNDELQRLDEQFSAELAELANDIYLNGELFARVDAVWQRRESLGLDSESIRLVEVIHQRFVLAGAKLEQADKAKLKVLNTEAATLTSQFNQRLLAANKSGGLVVNDIAQLAGMSEQEIALAAEAAREKGLDNNWLIPLLNTTQQPALAGTGAIARRVKNCLLRAGRERKKMMPMIPALSFNVWWRSARSRRNCLVFLIMPHGKSPIRWQKRQKQRSTLCGKLFQRASTCER